MKEPSPEHFDNDDMDYDPSEIQINVSAQVLNQRIEHFKQRKRQELDGANVLEFCNRHVSEEAEYSCARTDSIPVKRKEGRGMSHLRQTCIVNSSGPQTKDYMDKHFDPLEHQTSADNFKVEPETYTDGIEERIQNIEAKTGLRGEAVKPISRDVYARLKVLEDRLAYLEGMSPEYFSHKQAIQNLPISSAKSTTSDDQDSNTNSKCLSDLNVRIQELQNSLKVKEEPRD